MAFQVAVKSSKSKLLNKENLYINVSISSCTPANNDSVIVENFKLNSNFKKMFSVDLITNKLSIYITFYSTSTTNINFVKRSCYNQQPV